MYSWKLARHSVFFMAFLIIAAAAVPFAAAIAVNAHIMDSSGTPFLAYGVPDSFFVGLG